MLRGGPDKAVSRLIDRAVNALLTRPWLDDAALKLITRWYFPISRAWATALAADGDREAFLSVLPCRPVSQRLLPRALAAVYARKCALEDVQRRWEEAFFSTGPAMAAMEADRVAAAQTLMRVRSAFLPMHSLEPFPAVAWDIEAPHSVCDRHATRLAPSMAFRAAPQLDKIEASRGFRGTHGVQGWIRFPSPVRDVGGTAWARVAAPIGNAAPVRTSHMPSMIFCHGIGMEPEFWKDQRLALHSFVDAGIRVIRPEAPWHGRRRAEGSYGGEPIFARGPGGLLDYFHAAVREIGTMIAWARATRGGPVALAGVSLGALTAQLVATAATQWPSSMQPDALFLIAPSISITRVTFEGSLTRSLGVPAAVLGAGWTPPAIEQWRSLLEPVGPPVLEGDRIVVVLGETDDVTLAEGGENLVDTWRVPATNVFRLPAGHFTTALAFMRDGPAGRRFRSLMTRLGA
ncbi:MAG: alpha/beta fold hydrolase [Rhodospirillales bacterium]